MRDRDWNFNRDRDRYFDDQFLPGPGFTGTGIYPGPGFNRDRDLSGTGIYPGPGFTRDRDYYYNVLHIIIK